jgi:LPS-assembly protein
VQYRHKSENSDTSVYGEYLPSDDLFGDDRDMLSLRHNNRFTDSISMRLNYNDVSDVDYFDDFRNGESYFSATYVPRDLSFSYSGEYLSATLSTKEYQVIDSAVSEQFAPYERSPELTFRTRLPSGPAGLEYGVKGSVVEWSQDFRIQGTRSVFTPYVELPLENLWGFVTPRVDYHFRKYSLDNVDVGANDSPSFDVPVFSLDTGIFLEKTIDWFGDSALQTLEPRVFYAYASAETDQFEAPLFDTSATSQNNISSIFRANRFYGSDRVGDTNQITFGVTSRIIDNETGDERLKFELGQLYLIEDQEIGLREDDAAIESGAGDLLLLLSGRNDESWESGLFLQYDHDQSEIRTARINYGYAPKEDSRKRFDISYYYSNRESGSNIDQVSLSGRWPLTDRWSVFGNSRYSLEDSESLSSTIGLQFNNCCWALRFVANDRLTNNNIDERKQSVFMELELTGLGKFSSNVFSSDE